MASSASGRVWIDGTDIAAAAAQLQIRRDIQQIPTALPRPDPSWTFTDAAGHFHAYSEDKTYPTLLERSEHRDCDGSCGGVCEGDGYTVVIRECRICREVIQPGLLHGEHHVTVEGPMDWEIAVETALVQHGEVSVRFRQGESKYEYFGVASIGDRHVENGPGGFRGRTMLHALSPLGRRPVKP